MRHLMDARPLEQRTRELEILNSIATALNESVGLADSLQAALSRVAELLQLETGWVWLLDELTDRPQLVAAQNLPTGLRNQPERMEGPCFCLTQFRRGTLDSAANVVACSRLEWLTEGTAGLRFHASIPLHARGRRLGVMNIASTEWCELSEDELRLLHIIGEMLGVAIERSRLFEQSAAAGAAEERNRLAREIHDTLAQGLAATALQLETAEALLESGAEPERLRTMVRRALETTRQNLEDARRSVLDLRPAPLDGLSLADALEELCRECTPDEAPSIHFHGSGGSARPLPARVEAGLYRIAQEALSNALRHAGAQTISVRLHVRTHRVVLTVEDNGCGLVDETYRAQPASDGSERFGLIGMCERARLLGGELDLQSVPGAGTRVEARVPLD